MNSTVTKSSQFSGAFLKKAKKICKHFDIFFILNQFSKGRGMTFGFSIMT